MGNQSDSTNINNNYHLSINFIGNSMKDLLITISGLSYSSKASGRINKTSIFDYWDYFYRPELNFISQVNEIVEKFSKMKTDLSLDFKECLIVHITDLNSPKIDIILEKINKINREQYIPTVLFLSDIFDEDDKNFIDLQLKVYNTIISRYQR